MRFIVYPFLAGNKAARAFASWFGATLIVGALLFSGADAASERPRYGGTLRAQTIERISTIDPRQPTPTDSMRSAGTDRIASLVFDRLVRLDDHGMPVPGLAVSWQHDAPARRWQFLLRKDVEFSDGTPFTSQSAASALQQLFGNAADVSATVDSIVIQSDHAVPDLPAELAAGRNFIFHVMNDGSLTGTGPFRLAEWTVAQSSTKVVLLANKTCWAGRPFVDRVEISMGVDPQQQDNAISFGKADIVELPASEVRHATQRLIRTASSEAVELFALVFDLAHPHVQDARIRQAVSLAIDRSSIGDVVLQREGTIAGSLLPNWLSGYAHLFLISFDPPHAKELLAASGREPSHPLPLVLIYDSGDAEARAIADRVAVNLREVGIALQINDQSTVSKNSLPDMRLVRLGAAAPDPEIALADRLAALGESVPDLGTMEQVYAAERAPIDAFRVVPLVHISESYGLSPQVRDWMPPRWGGWRLEDVWLESPTSTEGPSR